MRGPRLAARAALFIPCVIALLSLGVIERKTSLSGRDCSGNVFEWFPNRINGPTEMGQVVRRLGEPILIFGPSPEIQKFSSLLDIDDVLGGDRWERMSRREPAGSSRFGAKKAASGRDITGESIIRREDGISQLAIGLDNQIFGRGFAAVIPNRPKSPIVLAGIGSARVPVGVDGVRENEGFFICYKGFSSQDSLRGRGAPEGGREGRDDDGSESGDRPIVLVNEITSTFGVSTDRAKESGWVFFGGIAFAMCLVVGDALFEAWRKKPLTRNKGRQKNR